MKKKIALALALSATAIGLSSFAASSANALEIRDHRRPHVMCLIAPCPTYPGPVVVMPPPPPGVGTPPLVVVDPIPRPPTGPLVVVDPVRPQPWPPIEPPHRPHHSNPWADNNYDSYDGITCNEGRRILRQHGFKKVRAMDCSGEIYRYQAFSRKHGPATVLVNMDGDIVRVNYWVALR
jgi:hypothetical protein